MGVGLFSGSCGACRPSGTTWTACSTSSTSRYHPPTHPHHRPLPPRTAPNAPCPACWLAGWLSCLDLLPAWLCVGGEPVRPAGPGERQEVHRRGRGRQVQVLHGKTASTPHAGLAPSCERRSPLTRRLARPCAAACLPACLAPLPACHGPGPHHGERESRGHQGDEAAGQA